MIWTTIS